MKFARSRAGVQQAPSTAIGPHQTRHDSFLDQLANCSPNPADGFLGSSSPFRSGCRRRHIDTDRGLRLPYLPHGRFLHVPPTEPSADWDTEFGTPWWQSRDYTIGRLSAKTRKVYIVNALTQQKDLLEVCAEETIEEIRERYMEYNAHAMSYTWKKLGEDGEKFEKLMMGSNLADNGIEDEDDAFEDLGIDDGFYYPAIHVYFNDDLTYA